MEKSEILRRFPDEFKRLCNRADNITLSLTPLEVWTVLCQLQLAFRHPRNNGPTCNIAIGAATKIEASLCGNNEVLRGMAEMGWNPNDDETVK